MPSIFTQIIHGEIPCYKVAEDDHFIAFLDINPNAKGHTLCVPKKEVNRLFDLNEETYMALMKFSRKVAHALRKTISCDRVGMAVIGLEVPHVHIHLIPINEMKEMTFAHKVSLAPEEMSELAEKIGNNL